MKSIKPGRGPSILGGIMAIAIAVFGILWTIGAGSITGGFGGTSFEGDFMVSGMDIVTDPEFGMMGGGFGSDPFDTMGTIFPLFGVVFVIIAIVIAVYNFRNATSKNRYSEFDIVDGNEEPDPMNERFGSSDTGSRYNEAGSDDALFCPYCGTPAEDDYMYCKKCGKRLPEE
ncbi:MAG: zinc ribbon domain-containing protein [Clostridia bacterium]|nr:zinc ribbon domain-containing protein [Clostridia bacterium]